MPSSSSLYISIRNMEANGEMGLLGDHLEADLVGKLREDGYDSRSGSDVPSGDELDGSEEQPRRRKKYHRHTPHQIQELENFFKECPHPDEKQRTELSRRLSLENKQVKFWFQNRRTQTKTQLERHENMLLRQENDKLRGENVVIKEALSKPICNTCGGPAIPGHVSLEEHHLRIENARLKDELSRICALAGKFLGRPLSPSLELAVGRNGRANSVENFPALGLDMVDGASSFMPPMPLRDGLFDRTMFVDLALAAMDELFKLVHVDSPLWIKNQDGGKETLNYEEYARMSNPSIRNNRPGFVREATRDSQMVIINSLAIVETLMDTNRWAHMFPCLIARAATMDTISNGMNGTRNGALQLIKAELQVLSPLVPVRPIRFLRFCKQHADGLWAVVDVSIDINQEASNSSPFFSCRKLPSGCIVQDMPNGYSKVTWVEHTEYDETYIHQLYRPLISSGFGFGAERWLVTLQRQCECLAILISSSIPNDDPTGVSLGGRRSMLKLAQRMVDNFCSGVCASSLHKWEKLLVSNVSEDVKVMMRKSMDDPGEPPGIVLSAATSVWIAISEQKVFEFLRDDRLRSEWDILSNGGPMQEMVHIAKGRDRANCVSLLRASAVNANESTMLILQETWSDSSGSLIVYAPVDTPSINLVMHGGDSAYVSLLPSGFSILPDGRSNNLGSNGCDDGRGNGGCLLTVSFQILVNNIPTAKLTMESVETVNNLISCTIKKIKDALRVT